MLLFLVTNFYGVSGGGYVFYCLFIIVFAISATHGPVRSAASSWSTFFNCTTCFRVVSLEMLLATCVNNFFLFGRSLFRFGS